MTWYFQTGSQQRSSQEFRRACELVRSGRIGKLQRIIVDVGSPSRPCDLPEEEMEPGLNWDAWLGPAPERPYNSVLSPRGVHDHFPAWRDYQEYSGGMMTDWGAHHFDIAQWALDMDESGPVEIIPPEDPNAQRGVRYVYANGVEVIHGESGGVRMIGEDGEILVNRGKLESTPESILETPRKNPMFSSTVLRDISETGSTASALANAPSAMWRSEPGRLRSATWAIWPTGITAS
jgi:predicted dehydrogenase